VTLDLTVLANAKRGGNMDVYLQLREQGGGELDHEHIVLFSSREFATEADRPALELVWSAIVPCLSISDVPVTLLSISDQAETVLSISDEPLTNLAISDAGCSG
jgi:hypothetical protein